MSYTHLGHGVYRDSRTRHLYHRPRVAGRRTWRKLSATTVTMARKEVGAIATRQLEARLGIVLDPFTRALHVEQIAKLWLAENCPYPSGQPRAGLALASEQGRLRRLLPFWKNCSASTPFTAEDCNDYHRSRTRSKQRGRARPFSLNRSVDAELTTLAGMFRWAARNPRKTGLRRNPMPDDRPRFDRPKDIRHCTAVMPTTDEMLHTYAAYLLGSDRSRPLGWQLLLEALTGARTSEILACRINAAQPLQPGYLDDTALHIHRLKKGVQPWALLEVTPGHKPLAELLEAFHAWHKKEHPRNPWYIPGRVRNEPMHREALTRALKRASKTLGLPEITSHGLRAYYVLTLRSLGVDDSEIAKRLGHRSGVGEVEKTYGVTVPGWFGSKKLDFIPRTMPPAWAPWLPRKGDKIIPLPGITGNSHTPANFVCRYGAGD